MINIPEQMRNFSFLLYITLVFVCTEEYVSKTLWALDFKLSYIQLSVCYGALIIRNIDLQKKNLESVQRDSKSNCKVKVMFACKHKMMARFFEYVY